MLPRQRNKSFQNTPSPELVATCCPYDMVIFILWFVNENWFFYIPRKETSDAVSAVRSDGVWFLNPGRGPIFWKVSSSKHVNLTNYESVSLSLRVIVINMYQSSSFPPCQPTIDNIPNNHKPMTFLDKSFDKRTLYISLFAIWF